MFFTLTPQRLFEVKGIYTFVFITYCHISEGIWPNPKHNSSFKEKKKHTVLITKGRKKKQGSHTVHCPGTQLSNPHVWVCVEPSQIKQRVNRLVRSQLHTQSESFPEMRAPWAGAHLLPVLVLVSVLHVKAGQNPAKERHYYIAAVEIDWNYSGNVTKG